MWENKEGEQIKISDMSDQYLLNAIAYVNKKAKEGMTIYYGGGFDLEDMWYDEEEIKGEEVFEYFDGYEDLIKEAKRRNLNSKPKGNKHI